MKIKWFCFFPIILTYVIFAILLNSVGAVILQSTHSFEISKQSAGMLEGFKDIPIAFVSLFIASFLPRLGYAKSLKIGLSLVCIACILMPLLPGFLTTKLLFLTLGASFAVVKVSIYSLVGTITFSRQQHISTLNMIEGFFMAGVLLGNWLFSLFMQNTAGNHDWLQVYWFLAGLCLLNLGLFSLVKLPVPVVSSYQNAWSEIKPMFKLFSQTVVMIFILSVFMYVLIEQSFSTWLPTFNHEVLHFTPALSTQAASLFAGMLALGRILSSILLQTIHWFKLLSLCILLMALLLLFLPVAQTFNMNLYIINNKLPISVIILPAIGLCMAPIYPALNSLMLSELPHSEHASMTGIIVIFSALGGTFGSLITGHLFSFFGGVNAFYALLAPLILLYFATHFLQMKKKPGYQPGHKLS